MNMTPSSCRTGEKGPLGATQPLLGREKFPKSSRLPVGFLRRGPEIAKPASTQIICPNTWHLKCSRDTWPTSGLGRTAAQHRCKHIAWLAAIITGVALHGPLRCYVEWQLGWRISERLEVQAHLTSGKKARKSQPRSTSVASEVHDGSSSSKIAASFTSQVLEVHFRSSSSKIKILQVSFISVDAIVPQGSWRFRGRSDYSSSRIRLALNAGCRYSRPPVATHIDFKVLSCYGGQSKELFMASFGLCTHDPILKRCGDTQKTFLFWFNHLQNPKSCPTCCCVLFFVSFFGEGGGCWQKQIWHHLRWGLPLSLASSRPSSSETYQRDALGVAS